MDISANSREPVIRYMSHEAGTGGQVPAESLTPAHASVDANGRSIEVDVKIVM